MASSRASREVTAVPLCVLLMVERWSRFPSAAWAESWEDMGTSPGTALNTQVPPSKVLHAPPAGGLSAVSFEHGGRMARLRARPVVWVNTVLAVALVAAPLRA